MYFTNACHNISSMKYKNLTIYYMSGTGNSYRTACWMIEAAKKKGLKTALLNMETYSENKFFSPAKDRLLGIIMPTHGFTAPWPALKLALMLPRGKGTSTFITPCRAGTKVGPFHLPGMEGTAGYLTALILVLKNYRIRGVSGIDMPSNWISFHWGLHPKNANSIITRASYKVTEFINHICEGRRRFPPGSMLELVFGIALLPVSLGYLLFGRFYLAKLFFANYTCNGCGICVRNCPHGGIRMKGKQNPRPYWTFSCESCMRCMAFCPEKAIEASHSFGYILYLVTSIPASLYITNWISKKFPMNPLSDIGYANILMDYVYFFMSLFLFYLLFNLLTRIKIINMFFTFTTLTHIYRRYHEPDTRLKDIKIIRK